MKYSKNTTPKTSIRRNTLPRRRRLRRKGYDYTKEGSYFLTIITYKRARTLSKIIPSVAAPSSVPSSAPSPMGGSPALHLAPTLHLTLTDNGNIIDKYIHLINEKYPSVSIPKYVIMPEHVHLILTIKKMDSLPPCSPCFPSPTVGTVMGWFKYQTTKEINQIRNTPGNHIWHRSYHDIIIPDQPTYNRIYRYIHLNPARYHR